MRPCLDCGVPSDASRCPRHRAERKRIRNADRRRSREVVAAEPWCHCTSRRCPHDGLCGAIEDLTADHVRPLARGGTNDGDRVVLCRSCNSRKGARWSG